MPKSYDVIVAGVGSMGSAACYHLARAGVKVLGLDSQNVPNTNSSYNGNTRMIRLSYQEHPDYVPLLHEAYRLWNELEEETGAQLLHKTGILYMGAPDGEAITGVKLASKTHNLHYTALTHQELNKAYPQFNLPDSMVGVHENAGGYLLCEQAVSTYTTAAIEHSATIQSNEPVTNWKADENGVSVTTPLNTYHAHNLIITAGAWSNRLLRFPPSRLRVTRQVLGWVWPARPELFRAGEFPVWLIDPGHPNKPGGVYYGFPLSNGASEGVGLKAGWHFPGTEMDPDEISQAITERDREEIMAPFQHYMPDALGPLLAIKVCKYTNTPDGHFIVDQHPESNRVHVACGFSGHGFKFASAIGRILTELATTGQSSHPIQFLSHQRFPNDALSSPGDMSAPNIRFGGRDLSLGN